MMDYVKKIMDLNSNGKIEKWEVAIFVVGFAATAVFIDHVLAHITFSF